MKIVLLGILLLLGSGGGGRAWGEYTVDTMELNHRFDEKNGDLLYDQVIFWRFSKERKRLDSVGWLIIEKDDWGTHPVESHGWWTCRKAQNRKKFRAKVFRETFTTEDPDNESRKLNRNTPLESITE